MSAALKKTLDYKLQPDTGGMVWDLLLYVPTVVFLVFIGLRFWYGGNEMLAYLLCFLASFFLITGGARILKSRLMLLPHAPTGVKLSRNNISVRLRNGEQIDLVKEVRFFSDYAGKSFGLTGMDLSGRKQQFILHRGQFPSPNDYNLVVESLKKFG